MDIVPTICDLARIAPLPLAHGKSLLPFLRGKESLADRAIVSDVPNNVGKAVCTAQCKLITYANDPNDMLFDMQTDPLETRNLVHDPSHAGTVKELRSHLLEWSGHWCRRTASIATAMLGGAVLE